LIKGFGIRTRTCDSFEGIVVILTIYVIF